MKNIFNADIEYIFRCAHCNVSHHSGLLECIAQFSELPLAQPPLDWHFLDGGWVCPDHEVVVKGLSVLDLRIEYGA